MNRSPIADATDWAGLGRKFPRRFYTLELDTGHFRIVEEMPDNVLRFTTEEAVISEIVSFTSALPADYQYYKFDHDKCRAAFRYWSALYSSRFDNVRSPIHAVLQKSTRGWCWHRLDFDMTPGDTPLFDEFLSRIEDGAADAFQAFVGMLLDMSSPRQQYLWMYGGGENGKGTFLRLLKRVFQRSYVAATAGKQLRNDKFFTSRFLDARLGVFADCQDPYFVTSEIFMMLTGGDAIPIEKKGKDVITAEIPTLFIVSSNEAPAISGSHAHRRRIVPIKIADRKDKTTDPSYEEKLWAERSAILWKCWDAWTRHKKEFGRVNVGADTVTEIVEDAETRYSSIVSEFFVVKPDIVGTLTPEKLCSILTKEARLGFHEIRHFHKYLERLNVNPRHRTKRGAPRVVAGLHLKSSMTEQGKTQPQF